MYPAAPVAGFQNENVAEMFCSFGLACRLTILLFMSKGK